MARSRSKKELLPFKDTLQRQNSRIIGAQLRQGNQGKRVSLLIGSNL